MRREKKKQRNKDKSKLDKKFIFKDIYEFKRNIASNPKNTYLNQ